ncbi:FadR/GntR family transcriptional regulator [Halobacillus naozhouensis]|uniref:GntR family transcriptional regulator n=1 Tax=Halobacillus naozhouensis TaxID=554880 RepID=A0ABY8J241_9BACI|nr:GntR family transcriptional regulator [Halobacillus naozhouensis]WFT75642.1 GntR family transcriptional regulator [Halobacillus naozhouensis]
MKNNYRLDSVPRMFEEVIRQIISYIQENELRKGDKLPTERKLSELLEVSRSSVREGLRILELLKYLESRQGGGTFVSEPPPFLIPMSLIQQDPGLDTLRNYFGVAIMSAEKIIIKSLKQETSVSLHSRQKLNFWAGFSAWINELGNQLSNDYYLSLWNNIYLLLNSHEYFENVTTPMELDDLKIAFYKEDQEILENFFSSFHP